VSTRDTFKAARIVMQIAEPTHQMQIASISAISV
jgi:hypothetical protein